MSSSLTRLRRYTRGMPSGRLESRAAESETFSFNPNASGVGANAGNWWIARTPLALRSSVSVSAATGLSWMPTGGGRGPEAVAALDVLRPHGQRRRFRRRRRLRRIGAGGDSGDRSKQAPLRPRHFETPSTSVIAAMAKQAHGSQPDLKQIRRLVRRIVPAFAGLSSACVAKCAGRRVEFS